MQTELNSPGRIPTTERQISQRARRLPRKGLMNENGLLGFLPPSPQSLPTRLPSPKENRQGLMTRELGNRARPHEAARGRSRLQDPGERPPSPWDPRPAVRTVFPFAPHHTVTFIRCFPPPPSFFLATTTLVFHIQIKLFFVLFCLLEGVRFRFVSTLNVSALRSTDSFLKMRARTRQVAFKRYSVYSFTLYR
jgi:hypothetical protein